MFSSVSIHGFRGFSEIAVESLGRVNLITGTNAVGKTALLEAIYLLIGETNAGLVAKINAFRGMRELLHGPPDEILEFICYYLFHGFVDRSIVIMARDATDAIRRVELRLVTPEVSSPLSLKEDGAREATGATNGLSSRVLEVSFSDGRRPPRVSRLLFEQQGLRVRPPHPPLDIPGYYLAARASLPLEEDAKNYGQLAVAKESYDLIQVLRIVDNRLCDIKAVPSPAGTVLWGDVGLSRMLPLALISEGLARLTSIMVKVATARNGVVLVDEIENGLHHTVLRKVWTAVREAARRFDVQIFATTHSWECARAAHEAFSEGEEYDFRLHRLERVGDRVRAVTYDAEALATAVDAGWEVR